jgi:hypothetical protein
MHWSDFFYLAREFRCAYETLPDSGHPPEWPKYVLFYHAIELALKAYLISKGVSEAVLSARPFGHDITELVDEAVSRGLTLPPGTQKAIADLGHQPQQLGSVEYTVAAHLRIRYPRGGPVYWPLKQFDPRARGDAARIMRIRERRRCGRKKGPAEAGPRVGRTKIGLADPMREEGRQTHCSTARGRNRF